MVLFVFMVATAAFTSFGTTSPRYIKQHAMYLPCRGSHLAIMEEGSKALGDNRGIRGKHKVDPRVRNQISLELSHVNIQRSIKPQRGSEG
ncbi:hypothetical protein CR513_31024, partial [Mucuna pruriens]